MLEGSIIRCQSHVTEEELREVQFLARGSTASNWQTKDSNLSHLTLLLGIFPNQVIQDIDKGLNTRMSITAFYM